MIRRVQDEAWCMQDGPERVGGPDRVEQVVPRDQEDADDGGHERRQADERSEQDHRPAERPQHEQHRHPIVEIELVGEAPNQHHLENDQPEPPREKESGQFTRRPPPQREVGARAREQEEHRRAEVRDPAREKQPRRRVGQVRGILPGHAEEVPRVIERHHDHDHAADEVDRFQARSICGGAHATSGLPARHACIGSNRPCDR